jgi:hypothetical protein
MLCGHRLRALAPDRIPTDEAEQPSHGGIVHHDKGIRHARDPLHDPGHSVFRYRDCVSPLPTMGNPSQPRRRRPGVVQEAGRVGRGLLRQPT